jgi:hypothetical protein
MMTRAILTVCAALNLIGCSDLDNCADARKEAIEIGERPQGGAATAEPEGDGGAAEPEGSGGAGGANTAEPIAEPIEPTPLIYESSKWGAQRVAFPAKTCLRFYHGLKTADGSRTTPEIVNSYVSFRSSGSDVTENAGNQGRIKCVDSEQIVIMNDTCEDEFFIRVVAYASGSADASVECRTLKSDDCALP